MWFAPLIGGLIDVMGTLVGRVLISLGIAYFSYQGIDTSIMWAKQQFFSSAAGLDPLTLQVMSLLRIDQCVNLLVSAITARLTFSGMQAGAMKLARLK